MTKSSKPKKAVKRTATRKTKSNRSSRATTTIVPVPTMSHKHFICSNTDPFCDHAIGGKIMDMAAQRTLSYTSRWMTSAISNAFGNLLIGVSSPAPGYQTAVPFDVNLNQATVPVGNWPALGLPFAGSSIYRIVSYGLRIRCVGPMLSSSGIIRVCIPNSAAWPALSTCYTDDYNWGTVYSFPYKSGEVYEVIPVRFAGLLKTAWYNSPTATASYQVSFNNCYYPVIVIVLGGQPTQTLINIEHFAHFEFTFDDSNSMAQITQPAPTYQVGVDSAVNTITSKASNVLHKGLGAATRAIEDQASKAAASLLQIGFQKATTAVLSRMGARGKVAALAINAAAPMEVD